MQIHIPATVTIVQYLMLRDMILAPAGPMSVEQTRAKQGDLLRLRDAFNGYDPRS